MNLKRKWINIYRQLLNCDIRTEEGVKYALDNNLFKEFCPKMIESATKITENYLQIYGVG